MSKKQSTADILKAIEEYQGSKSEAELESDDNETTDTNNPLWECMALVAAGEDHALPFGEISEPGDSHTLEATNEEADRDVQCAASNTSQPVAIGEQDAATDKSRKRVRNPDAWVRNVRKKKRNTGKEYVSYRGKKVPAKSQKGPCCACRSKCYNKISEAEADSMFAQFLEIGTKDEQDAFLYGLMQGHDPQRRRDTPRPEQEGNQEKNPNAQFHLLC